MAIDAQWWLDEEQELDAILFRHLFAAAVKGAQTALAALAEEWAAGVDWGLVNEAAMRWARRISPELAATITGTTRKFVTQALSDWVASGRPKAELVDTLKPMFGKVRAQMIGTTEITRAYFEGNRATWKESDVVDGWEFRAAEDELVCPYCGEVDGKQFGLDEIDQSPPLHPRCRCWAVPVVNI